MCFNRVIWYLFFSCMYSLNGVRGFKGDVKLSAKIGKVLWSQITPDVQKQIWSYTDLNDRLMSNAGVKPVFNNV